MWPDVPEFEGYPGWKWIRKHWQEGPYYLLAVANVTLANWQVQWFLQELAPLVTGLPAVHPEESESLLKVNVYAVPEFVYELAMWHTGDPGPAFFGEEHVVLPTPGSFPELPGPGDVLARMPQWWDPSGEASELRTLMQETLQDAQVSAPVVLDFLAQTVTTEDVDVWSDFLEDDAVDVFRAAVAASAVPAL